MGTDFKASCTPPCPGHALEKMKVATLNKKFFINIPPFIFSWTHPGQGREQDALKPTLIHFEL